VTRGPWRARRIVLIGLAAAIVTGLSGCGWFGTSSRTVYEDSTIRVSLEADPTVRAQRSPPNDHPVKFDSAQMIMLLKGVEVERAPSFLKSLVSGPTREPAFSQEEILALAPRLTEALAQASSTDRVSYTLTGRSPSPTRDVTTGRVWVQGNGFHLALDRYRLPEGGRKTDIPEPYQSSYSRGRGAPQNSVPDFSVLFSPSSYMIPRQASLTAQMLASPETEVVVDYQRLFSDASKGRLTAVADGGQDRGGRVNPSGMADVEGPRRQQDVRIQSDGGDQAVSSSTVRLLTERVKALETEVASLLDIMKGLTGSLEEARKALAAKDQQIQMLLSGPRSPATPKLPKAKSEKRREAAPGDGVEAR
jgi:hypothetical protein